MIIIETYFQLEYKMKIKIFLSLCFAVALLCGCESNLMKDMVINEDETQTNPAFRSLHPPGFEINWEEQTQITITTDQNPVDLPWVQDCPTSIPWDTRMDIKKTDGWVFLSTDSRQTGTDYMIFYNRYTGMLKVFYYNNNSILTNNAVWELYDELICGFFNQGAIYTAPMSTAVTRQVGVNGISHNSTLGVDRGWNCFQIPLTYTSGSMNGRINIYSRILNISELTLEGNYTETTTGTIIEDRYTAIKESPLQKGINSVVKVSGTAANDWVKQQAKKSTDSKEKEGIFKNFGTYANNLLADLAKEGVSGLVKSGLNALFGSFLSSKTKTQVIQNVELTTNGKINIKGQMIANQTGMILPLTGVRYGKGLGAWNLRERPKVKAEVFHTILTLKQGNPLGKKYLQEYYEITYTPSYEVVINPDIAKDITYTVSHNFVEFTSPGGNKYAQKVSYNDAYSYANNALMPMHKELSLDANTSSILLGPVARVAVAVNSSDNWVNPVHQNYNTNFSKYIDARIDTPYLGWVSNVSQNFYEYYPKSLFPFKPSGSKTYIPIGSEVGLNVTVKMTVKATGQEIVSSRTYMIDYELQEVK